LNGDGTEKELTVRWQHFPFIEADGIVGKEQGFWQRPRGRAEGGVWVQASTGRRQQQGVAQVARKEKERDCRAVVKSIQINSNDFEFKSNPFKLDSIQRGPSRVVKI
jgi:hypothetical protein